MKKERLDVLLQNKGLAESRTKAQAIIMEGLVFVAGQRVDKPGNPLIPRRRLKFEASSAPM